MGHAQSVVAGAKDLVRRPARTVAPADGEPRDADREETGPADVGDELAGEEFRVRAAGIRGRCRTQAEDKQSREEAASLKELLSYSRKKKEKDPLMDYLLNLRKRMSNAKGLLCDDEKTAFFFVTLPEALPIAVIRRFISWFDEFGIPVGGVVVNMLIDKSSVCEDTPDFVKNRVAMQDEYMEEIWRVFPDVRAVLPLFDTEVQGVEMLKRTADHLRGILNQTYMVMLERKGMYSCIADAYDDKLVAIARGKRPDVVELIHKVMDGESVDVGSLSKELQGYVKTARVILGHSLYSDSWLEL